MKTAEQSESFPIFQILRVLSKCLFLSFLYFLGVFFVGIFCLVLLGFGFGFVCVCVFFPSLRQNPFSFGKGMLF